MARDMVLRLRALPVCLALVQLLSPCLAARFAVLGPPERILVMVGEDAELPCHLSPRMSAETMELIWMRHSPRQVVHTYTPGQEDKPAPEYRGRTSMLRENITAGKAALRIRDVIASDSGTYLCYFQDGDFFENAQVVLQVAGPFFQDARPWVVAFAVTLPALLLLLAVAGCLLRKIHGLSQEKERERSTRERLQHQIRWTKTYYPARGKPSQVYAEWKTTFFQPADVFLDPDTAHPKLRVSEDKRSLRRAEKWENLPCTPGRFYGNECVLGSESFTSGRHFWEVDVGDREQWRVGVCRDNVSRLWFHTMTPKNGFWVIRLSYCGEFSALTDPKRKLTNMNPPRRLGVFLDYEGGEVSFYNAINGLHIFTFPHTRFSGPLRPLFYVQSRDPTALTIRPAQGAVGTPVVRDPRPDPPLETPVAQDAADGKRMLRLK